MLFFRIFQHLLPQGAAWVTTITKTLRRFFLGLSEQPTETRTFLDKVYLDLFPETARSKDDADPNEASGALEEWERQFGIEPNADEATRRLALAAEWRATGGQSPGYIQGVLHTAGFTNLFVFDFWLSGPPYVARDPRDYTNQPLVGIYQCTGDGEPSQPQCSDLASQPQCNGWLSNETYYLVNKDLTRRAPPPIPDDEDKWPYFFYVGPEAGPEELSVVDPARRAELERLLLKIRPTHLWIVLRADFGGGVDDDEPLLAEDGNPILTEDSESLFVE